MKTLQQFQMSNKTFTSFMEQYHPADSTPPHQWDAKATDYKRRGLTQLQKYAEQRAKAQRKKIKDSGLGNRHHLARKP